MTTKLKNIVVSVLFAAVLTGMSLFAWLKPADEYSVAERRPLDQFPKLSADTILDATFMNSFEDYALDQFPMRDAFRAIKAFTALNIMGQMDVNDLYYKDGVISKVETETKKDQVLSATGKFNTIYDKYIKDKANKVYTSVVPDKNYFLADKYGYPSIDYNEMIGLWKENMSFGEYIDIFSKLDISDYYITDTHWKQQNIFGIAQHIAQKMGVELSAKYTENSLGKIFKGVYGYQFPLSFEKDELIYMTSDYQKDLKVYSYSTGTAVEIPLYVLENAQGDDPYNMFLSGAKVPLVIIENPNATTDRELVIFRDSFGSSLSPYFAEGYSKVTVVDPRTFGGAVFKMFVDNGTINFEGADVLFLFSTTLLNNSFEVQIF